MSYFSIFKYSKYTFDDKKPYENVILLLYRHWFVLVGSMLALIIILLFPILIYIFLGEYIGGYNLSTLYWFLFAIYVLVWWYALFYNLTMYLLDTWMVTDHRIIDSEQHGFFKRTVAELNLAKIQDISVKIEGLIPTFLDFGNLEIQTAGTEPKFLFKQIPHPNKVKDVIMQAHNDFLSTHKDGVEVHESGGVV